MDKRPGLVKLASSRAAPLPCSILNSTSVQSNSTKGCIAAAARPPPPLHSPDEAENLPGFRYFRFSTSLQGQKNHISRYVHAGSESVCRYNWHSAGSLGWPFPMLKYEYIFFRKKYTEAISSNSTRKLLWFEITRMPIAV